MLANKTQTVQLQSLQDKLKNVKGIAILFIYSYFKNIKQFKLFQVVNRWDEEKLGLFP